jgi:hypothetical protein
VCPYPRMVLIRNRAWPHRVCTVMRRFPWIAAAIMLITVTTACSRRVGAADVRPAFEARAKAVAEAWRPTVAAPAWGSGLLPLQNLTVASGLDDDARQALTQGWFTTGVRLPQVRPAPGRVVFPDGPPLVVPVLSARAAFDEMQIEEPPRDGPGQSTPQPLGSEPDSSVAGPVAGAAPRLTVTAATLATTTLLTSRGTATVPAWIFSVAESPVPIARVAVAVLPIPEVSVAEAAVTFAAAHRLTAVDGARLDFTIGIGACQDGPGGLVHETDQLVVVGGDPGTSNARQCVAILQYEPVSVTLRSELGARPVIDAATGKLLILGDTRP